MKKSLCLGLAVLVLLISGCSQKKVVSVEKKPKMQEFAFDLFYFDLTGNVTNRENKAAAQKIKLPESLKKLLLHKTVVENKGNCSVLYLAEIIYPECRGYIDSFGFYSPEGDNGRWVDKVVFQYQENMVGGQIDDLLELNPLIQEILQEEEAVKNGEEIKEEVSVEKILMDSQNRLKIMLFEKEAFIPQTKKDQRIFIHSDNKTHNVTRFFYNNQFKLSKKEIWNIPSAAEAKLLYTEEYVYADNSAAVKEKIITQEESILHTYYRDIDTVTKTELYAKKSETVKNTESGEKEEKAWFWKKSETSWEYNQDNKITSEVLTEYKEPEKENSAPETGFVKKQLFIYNKTDKEISPDYEYYENGVLKNRITYTAKGTYISNIFFDEDFTVTSYYENNKKVKDIYSKGGIVRRVKTYE